jgi:phosphoribosylformylglycinamidine synthase
MTPTARKRGIRAARRQGRPGLFAALTFDPQEDIAAPFVASGKRPRIAILREQGVNGQTEMAAAFDRAGFDAHDVHMSDMLSRPRQLSRTSRVWPPAAVFLRRRARRRFRLGQVHPDSMRSCRDEFAAFFNARHLRARRLQRLPDDEPAARSSFPAPHWPRFPSAIRSEQFEARFVMVESHRIAVASCLRGMAGSQAADRRFARRRQCSVRC